MASLLQRLKERKFVQWAIAYLAGAYVVYEGSWTAAEVWGISPALIRGIHVLLIVGFLVALVLAWYHGERGAQRVSGPELLIIALLLVIAGTGLSVLGSGGAVEAPGQPREAETVATTLRSLPGIAVLPFENRSDLSSDKYFTDGIRDDLLSRLSRVPGLRVPARTSSDEFENIEGRVIPEIARQLNVRYVLEGGVQRAGDQVRINVQLIDATTEDHLWAEFYDQVLSTESLLDIQSDIVRRIAAELDIELRQEERLRAARRSTTDLRALDLYLRAQEAGYWTSEAEELLVEATELDPGFVVAQAKLAETRATRYMSYGERGVERAAAARAAAERAVELAPESEDAQVAMAMYLYRVDKDYKGALDWISRAADALIGDSDYHRWSGYIQRRAGQWRKAAASLEAAAELSPMESMVWRELGTTFTCMRRYEEAEAALEESIRLGSPQPWRLAFLAWHRDGTTAAWQPFLESHPASRENWEVAMEEGRYEDALAVIPNLPEVTANSVGGSYRDPRVLLEAETLEALGQSDAAKAKYRGAIRALDPLIEATPDDERYHTALAWAYAGLGERDEAVQAGLRAVEILPRERDALDGPDQLFKLAAVYARLGDVDEALAVLDDLLSAPSRYSPKMLESHFRLRPIQDDPRFKALIDRERDHVF